MGARGDDRSIDTVFTFSKRDLVTSSEPVVAQILPVLLVDEVAEALGLEQLHTVPTGGDEFGAERNQWDRSLLGH